MTAARIAAKVSRGIARAGAKTGIGDALVGTIIRTADFDESVYPPVPTGPNQRFACTLFLSRYSARDREGTNLTERDMKAMIAANAEVEPENGDRLEVAGCEFALANVMPYMPGGTVLYWSATARSGE